MLGCLLQGLRQSLLLVLITAGLAAPALAAPSDQRDPWEEWNRKVFWFNETADEYVVEQCVEDGADYFLRKDVAANELTAQLRELVTENFPELLEPKET